MDLRGNVPQDDREILKLLIEVTGEQQHGVFEFALVAVQGAFAEIADHDRRADRDRRDQKYGAGNEPADRSA